MALWNPLTWLKRETKASAAGAAISAWNVGQPVWTDRRYETLADEGYVRNAIAYRCVKMIAQAAATVPWLAYDRDNEVENHDLLRLLTKPAPGVGGHTLFEAFFAYLMLSGNSYLEAVGPDGRPPRELWALRPDRMRVIAGQAGMPAGYEYEANGRTIRWDVDQLSGRSPILHMKEFHPLNDWYGLSPLEAAAYSVDRHNAAGAHNVALLQNGASPSGALVFRPVSGGTGQPAQSAPHDVIKAAEDRLESRHQGAANAGRPFVLGGDVDWKQMGITPKDMDFNEGKLDAARDICIGFGVPHILVVTGQATYNNLREAKLELYEETVLPLVDKAVDHLNEWLAPMFSDTLRLDIDKDEIPAMQLRREIKQKSTLELLQANVITTSEARASLQYEELPNGLDGNPDAGVITALLSAYDTGASTVEPLRRYLVAMGLLDASVTDDDMVSTARGIAKRIETSLKKAQTAQAAALTGEVDGMALGKGLEDMLAEDEVLPNFAETLREAADAEPIRFGGDGQQENQPPADPTPQDRSNTGG